MVFTQNKGFLTDATLKGDNATTNCLNEAAFVLQ